MNPDEQETEETSKSAKKFLLILMLIPIGLAVGVVTSNVNFRKKEAEKEELEKYKVSQTFNKLEVKDDMEKLLLSRDENSDYLLRHISSTLGINHYLTIKTLLGEGANLGYYDIVGKDKKLVTVVLVELDESNPIAKSALLAIPTAVIKSIAGEKEFSNTLRFVFLPKKHEGNDLNLKYKGESLKNVYTIKAGGDFTLDDDIHWRQEENIWLHPAMKYPHESVSDYITSGQVELSLQAARQLKEILLSKMKR